MCWLCGSFLLVWVGFTLWSIHNYQRAYAATLTHLERNTVRERVLHNGDLFGGISIPRLGISSVVVEGEGVDDIAFALQWGTFPKALFLKRQARLRLPGIGIHSSATLGVFMSMIWSHWTPLAKNTSTKWCAQRS